MSTSSTEPDTGPQSDPATEPDPQSPDPSADPAAATAELENEPDTFPRAYVEELRSENARHRSAAKKSTELSQRLTTAYAQATGRLHDARDLTYSDDLLDSDGYPDPEKVGEAVEALITQRPHLAKIRPTGDVGQGVVNESNPNELAAFGSFLRS